MQRSPLECSQQFPQEQQLYGGREDLAHRNLFITGKVDDTTVTNFPTLGLRSFPNLIELLNDKRLSFDKEKPLQAGDCIRYPYPPGNALGLEAVELCQEGDYVKFKFICVDAANVVCPAQSVTMSDAKCYRSYGAIATLHYTTAAKNWWWKEKVVESGSGRLCQPGPIDQSPDPQQMANWTVRDEILNSNGPPSDRAPCTDTTLQTAFIGPTKEDVERCQYQNTQEISVVSTTPKSGKVITTSNGESIECPWKKEV